MGINAATNKMNRTSRVIAWIGLTPGLAFHSSVVPTDHFKSARLFRGGGGVVVDDLPPVGKFAEDQREAAVRSLAVGQRQVPRAAHERSFGPEDLNAKIREIEFPHFVARTGVSRAIAIERSLPSARLFCIGKERELGRIPVAGHECVEIVTIPGVLLGEQNLLDTGAGVTGICLR